MAAGGIKIRNHLKQMIFGKSNPSPNNDRIKPFTFCSEERLRIAAAYWLEASDHEKTDEDGIIMAHFIQYALDNLYNIKFSDPIKRQCDGCQAQMPLEDGLHYNEKGKCHMACTKPRYT